MDWAWCIGSKNLLLVVFHDSSMTQLLIILIMTPLSTTWLFHTLKVSYGTQIRKIGCANHATKNLRKHLEAMQKDNQHKLTPKQVRKLVYSVRSILSKKLNRAEASSAIMNSVNHVGGNHESCREDLGCTHLKQYNDLPWGQDTVKQIQACSPRVRLFIVYRWIHRSVQVSVL